MAQQVRQWWRHPQLRTDQGERKVSWTELFYDLVFVVIISELARYLANDISLDGVLGYILLFAAAWWNWIGGTVYTLRFETEDVSYRVFMFLLMLPVAGMAIFAHQGLQAGAVGFALAYVAERIIVIWLWLRGGWYEPRFRPISNRYAIGFSISVALFVISIFVPSPWRFVLWSIGLLIDILTPITTFKFQSKLTTFNPSKLPERFGLFVLIVLGEAIVGVIEGTADHHDLSLAIISSAVCGMALVFGLWWVYFDFVARRGPIPGPWQWSTWSYLHMPLVMSIAAISASVQHMLATEGNALELNVRWLLVSAVALALASIGLIELTLGAHPEAIENRPLSVGLKLAGAALALLFGFFGDFFNPITLLLVLLLPVLIQMLYGLYVWVYHPVFALEEA